MRPSTLTVRRSSSSRTATFAAATAVLCLLAVLPACSTQASGSPTDGPARQVGPTDMPNIPLDGGGMTSVPRPKHVVLVVFENERASQIIGNPDAPYINTLARSGASFTQSYAVTHPSQPNYLALFSGSVHHVTDDNCGHSFTSNNQAHQLLSAGFTFTSYAEGLPHVGSTVCASGRYVRKHAPWTDFTNVPASTQQPFSSFPSDYALLPDVSWVIPDMCHDMHDCSVTTGDSWLKANLGAYAHWAKRHSSLLIVTFDEDDYSDSNHIATIFSGARVIPGQYDERITHYSVLATLERMYGLTRLGHARKAAVITDVWR